MLFPIMKRAILTIILTLPLLIYGCSDKGDICKNYAQRIEHAIASGNTAELATVDSLFRLHLEADTAQAYAWRQSLAMLADDSGSDSAAIAIRVIAETPDKLGQELFSELTENASISPKEKYLRALGISRFVYTAIGRKDDFLKFNSAYQKGIDAMPLNAQMQIYVSISTPQLLGEVLANDAVQAQGTPEADSVVTNVNQRIQELKKIYTPTDYDKMKLAFGRLILSTDAASIISSFDL